MADNVDTNQKRVETKMGDSNDKNDKNEDGSETTKTTETTETTENTKTTKTTETGDIGVKKHVMYFKRCSEILPSQFKMFDPNRMTVLFFCLSGLDILDYLHILNDRRESIIQWIYAQQIHIDDSSKHKNIGGFRGSPYLGTPFEGSCSSQYDCSHVTMTYTALASLLVLGDDLSRVNKAAILDGVKALQQPNGSFCSTIELSECDMRFVYCACCVCHILNDWSPIDKKLTAQYIKNSMGYDYGIGQGPELESHGGSTYCGIASLVLMNELHNVLSDSDIDKLCKWCINRQLSGFQGRPNKPADTCYSFWIGATLKMLGHIEFINKDLNTRFTLSTEGEFTGGFAKWPNHHPDPLHSYLGLCGLSLMKHSKLQPVHVALNITQRAVDWLQKLRSN